MLNPLQPTHVDGLALPAELLDLISNDHWPSTQHQAGPQLHSHKYISRDQVHRVADDETYIYLQAPPFCTVATCVKNGEEFWTWPAGRADEIDAEKSVIIADFQIGSDSAIILDYRQNPPCVRRLKYATNNDEQNHWIDVTDTFAEFAQKLDLRSVKF